MEQKHPLDLFRYCPVCGSADFVVNDFKSKRCGKCGFVFYMNPSASTVAVIINERGELLAVRRAKEPAKGTLDLPGGFSDMHESSEEGVRREVQEETGLEVVSACFLFSIPNLYIYSGLEIPTLDMFYLCEVRATDGGQAADDASELLWLPWDKIRPEEFGLTSIRQGVERLVGDQTVLHLRGKS